jgi:hypothetical protein
MIFEVEVSEDEWGRGGGGGVSRAIAGKHQCTDLATELCFSSPGAGVFRESD